MHINQPVTEITGTAAQFWGNALIPSQGTINIKITGDALVGTLKTGLESKQSWTRIQNIDSIEILEAPFYALLFIGSFLALFGFSLLSSGSTFSVLAFLIGCALVIFAIKKKRRYLVIYSHRYTIPLFMNKHSDAYQEFTMNVLMIARKLNAPASTTPKQTQTQVS